MQAANRQPKGDTGKGYKGMPMEGIVARWYAKIRRTESQIEDWRQQAAQLTAGLADGADVLEVAPGPGYFAMELAREHARQAGVQVEFQQGDASRMPFADGSFDLVVCQAAFKNFSRPIQALDEMYRVLRDGGTAVIQDMSGDVTRADIGQEVQRMQ